MQLFQSVSSVIHRCIANSAGVTAIAFAFVLLLGATQAAYCDTFTINFETLPSLPAQPNTFAAAGSMQTYSQAGIFTISGGVALGNPTFLPAFTANGSLPNLYGTTNFGDPSLSSTITLDLPTTAFQFTSVSFLLFNGQNFAERYQVSGMAGGIVLDPLPIGPLASAADSGFTTVTITSPVPITRLNITTPVASTDGWDFLIDNIVLTSTQVTAVPEPSSFALLIAPIGSLAFLRYRRLRTYEMDARRQGQVDHQLTEDRYHLAESTQTGEQQRLPPILLCSKRENLSCLVVDISESGLEALGT